MEYIIVFLGLAAGNYIYQAIHEKNWMKAFERTYFQGIAIVSVWIVILILR